MLTYRLDGDTMLPIRCFGLISLHDIIYAGHFLVLLVDYLAVIRPKLRVLDHDVGYNFWYIFRHANV